MCLSNHWVQLRSLSCRFEKISFCFNRRKIVITFNSVSLGLFPSEVVMWFNLSQQWWLQVDKENTGWMNDGKFLESGTWFAEALIPLVDRISELVQITFNIILKESVSGCVTDVVLLVLDVCISCCWVDVLCFVVNDVHISRGWWAAHLTLKIIFNND